MTAIEFREAMQGHLLLWGNAYAEIEMDPGGRVVALWPLRPDGMEKIEQVGDGLVYTYRLPSGAAVTLPGWRVLHLRGLSSNGITGYSPIQVAAREAIGKGLAIQKYGSAFFRNGARPGGVLTYPGELSPEATSRLRAGWQSNYGGLENAHRVAILEQGMDYKEVGIPPGDAAYIEDQKMSLLDVARVYGVPPHKIGELDRATFSNIEQQEQSFVNDCLLPWLERWEQAIEQRLMTEAESARYFVKFNVNGLLRGDTATRFQAYAMARQNGWMSANDIREKEDENPIEGGDVYLVPLNMVPAEELSEADVEAMAEAEKKDKQRWREELREFAKITGLDQRIYNRLLGAINKNIKELKSLDLEEGLEEIGLGYISVRLIGEKSRLEILKALQKYQGYEIRDTKESRASERVGLMRAQRPVFVEAMGRVVRRQAQDISNAGKKYLNRRSEGEFQMWLEEFWVQHRDWIVKTLLPLYRSYGATAALSAIREVQGDAAMADVEAFVEMYVDEFADFMVGKSRRKVEAALAEEDGMGALEAAVAIWVAEWPEALALRETVGAANAVSREVYRKAGVQELIWRTTWGDKSCAYCEGLDGVRVGIEGKFEVPGLPPFRNVAYPPVHDGCECVVEAVPL